MAFVHRLDCTSAPRITAFSLRIDRMHFPLTRDSTRHVRILMRGAKARAKSKGMNVPTCVCVACVHMCARVCVCMRVGGSRGSGCRRRIRRAVHQSISLPSRSGRVGIPAKGDSHGSEHERAREKERRRENERADSFRTISISQFFVKR